MNRKAEMGLGTLILFIALLLTVAIVAGILIQSSGSLQERALTTGSEAKNQISTNVVFSEIYGADGRTGDLTYFVMTLKLSPGSEALKFQDIMISLGSHDTTTTLEFRGVDGTTRKGATGYMTYYPDEIGEIGVYEDPMNQNVAQVPRVLQIDLDADGLDDTVETCRFMTNCRSFITQAGDDGKYLLFNLSSAGEIYVPMLLPDGSCCTSTLLAGNDYFGDHLNIHKHGVHYGTVYLYGQTQGSTTVHANNIRVYGKKILIDDLDDDGLDDYASINRTHVIILTGDHQNATIALSAPLTTDGVSITTYGDLIKNDGTLIGRINISGTSSTRWIIDANMTFTIIPNTIGNGYYSIEYLKRSKDFINGNIQRGDIARIYFETAKPIGESEDVLIRLIPKLGAPTNINLITPEVIVDNKIYLFP